MNIDNVELRPGDPTNLVIMSFRDPSRRKAYNVKSITGLDAESITPKYYGGANFHDLSPEPKEIVVNIQLNPYRDTTTPISPGGERTPIDTSPTTYSELRDHLYRMISSSRTGLLELRFKLGTTVIAAVSGFITKFESNLFDKDPGVQLTIRCDDPLLKALTPIILSSGELTTLQAMTPSTITDSLSTARHDFVFEMTISGTPASFKIGDPGFASWSFEVIPAGGFNNGDVLHINSDPKNKELYLVRSGTTIYLADVLTQGAIWPILFPGANAFGITPANFVWSLVSYYPTYWGV